MSIHKNTYNQFICIFVVHNRGSIIMITLYIHSTVAFKIWIGKHYTQLATDSTQKFEKKCYIYLGAEIKVLDIFLNRFMLKLK